MKFGWISDSHIGFQQYGLSERRIDFSVSIKRAITDMMQRGIKIVIHSGDLLHSNRPGPASIMTLLEINELLKQNGAVMWVIQGNHDRTDPNWIKVLANTDEKTGIQTLDFRRIEFADASGTKLSFYGVPYMSAEQFVKHEFKPADVLVMHQMVQEFMEFETSLAVKLPSLPAGYKLIAIGDVHIHKIIVRPGNPGCFVGYTGSTELYSASETEDKFWIEGTFDINRNLSLLPVPIPTRPVIRVNILKSSTTAADLDLLVTSINASISKDKDFRLPMIFIRYLNTIPDVIAKFQAMFNPQLYILRFQPVFGTRTGEAITGSDPVEENLSVDDILRTQVITKPELYGIASVMVNQNVDANAAIDEYIETRLRTIKAEPFAANV